MKPAFPCATLVIALILAATARAADYRITDYGTPADGPDPVDAALAAALDAAGSDPASRIVFPPGTWRLTRTLRIPASRHLRLASEDPARPATIRTGHNMDYLDGYHGGKPHRTVIDIAASPSSDRPHPLTLTLENLSLVHDPGPFANQRFALLRARGYIADLRIENCRFENYTHLATLGRLHLTDGIHPGSDSHTMIARARIAGNTIISDSLSTGQNPKTLHLHAPADALIEHNHLDGRGDGYIFRINGGGFDTLPDPARGATRITFRHNTITTRTTRNEYCQITKATYLKIHDNTAAVEAPRPGAHNFMDLFNCRNVEFFNNKATGGGLCFFGHADLNHGKYPKNLIGSRNFHAWDNTITNPTHHSVFNIGGDGTWKGNRATRDVLIERTTVTIDPATAPPGYDAGRTALIYSFISDGIELRDNTVRGIGQFVRTFYDHNYNIRGNTIEDVPALVTFEKIPGSDGETTRSHQVGVNRLAGSTGTLSGFDTLTGAVSAPHPPPASQFPPPPSADALPEARRQALARLLPARTEVPGSFGVNIRRFDNEPGMTALAALGAKWLRMDFTWHRVETQKGIHDFSGPDKLVADAVARGLRILAIIDYGNTLYEPHPKRITTDAGRAAFARYAAALAARYAGRDIIWEIWNEPNNAGFWPGNDPAEYMALLKTASAAIRSANPAAIVLGPACYKTPEAWLERCLQLGLLDHIDALSFHPYQRHRPENTIDDIEKIRALLVRHLPSGRLPPPVINSEWGFSSTHHGLEGHALRVPRSLLVAMMENLPLSIYYDIANAGQNPANSEHRYGLHGSPPHFIPRLPGLAYMATLRMLDGYTFSRRIRITKTPSALDPSNATPEPFVLEFTRGAQKIYAHWVGAEDDTATATWPLPGEIGDVTRADQYTEPAAGALLTGDIVTSTTSVSYLVPRPSGETAGDWRVLLRMTPLPPPPPHESVPWHADLTLDGPTQKERPQTTTGRMAATGLRDLGNGAVDFWIRPEKSGFGKTLVSAGDLKKPHPTLRIALDTEGNITATHWTWAGKAWLPVQKSTDPVIPGQWTRITYTIGKTGRRLYVDGLSIAVNPDETRGIPFIFQIRAENTAGSTGFLQLIQGNGYRP
ncbi:MAG: cellulase family glycosylhydrolase [Opitutaceae bacterium]|jgi:hypothetical protein|nr:cellulase family glycosylhydrolase [Opitutaceae bacterium]